MGKSVRDFILLVTVLCLSVASEAGIFDKVCRSLILLNKITQKFKKGTIGKIPYGGIMICTLRLILFLLNVQHAFM
jgi:hypothetical protein